MEFQAFASARPIQSAGVQLPFIHDFYFFTHPILHHNNFPQPSQTREFRLLLRFFKILWSDLPGFCRDVGDPAF